MPKTPQDMRAEAHRIDVAVGALARRYRCEAGLSQESVGDFLGLTFQQIQKYERGANRISAGRLVQLARLFNRPVDALFPSAAAAPKPAQADRVRIQTVRALSQLTPASQRAAKTVIAALAQFESTAASLDREA